MTRRLASFGANNSGISAALRAGELDEHVEVTLVVTDRFPNCTSCGLPIFLRGEISTTR